MGDIQPQLYVVHQFPLRGLNPWLPANDVRGMNAAGGLSAFRPTKPFAATPMIV
jgi:hypothetical protein